MNNKITHCFGLQQKQSISAWREKEGAIAEQLLKNNLAPNQFSDKEILILSLKISRVEKAKKKPAPLL